ncbi:DPP IV N-terminal domain-containing protein [Brevibacillus sp. NRS-1366]|uniref:S9 family peptidase n=1 Tax=Brevibacillus sp. NRS-1366 TaxID=3233899 RepID=UPI003D1C9E79
MSINAIREKYERAEKLLPTNTGKYVLNGVIKPHWLGTGDKFWYMRELQEGSHRGKQFMVVNAQENSCIPAFDHSRLATALSEKLGLSCDENNLPFEQFEYVDDDKAIQFHVHGSRYVFDLTEYSCIRVEELKQTPMDELPSPDGRWSAFVQNHNLFVRSLESGSIVQLTHDGIPNYDYASYPGNRLTVVYEHINGLKLPPAAAWSPDSKKLVTYRVDQRLVREVHLVQAVPQEGDDLAPVLHSYRYPLTGDEHVPQAELVICDIELGTVMPLQASPITLHSKSLFTPGSKLAGWSKKGDKIYFVRLESNHKSAQFCLADVNTGETSPLLEEHSDSFLHFDMHTAFDVISGQAYNNPNIRLLSDGNSFIWHSERDDWSHLYLYDAKTGKLKNRITSGSWVVRRLLEVDEQKGWVYFTAGGRESGRDPYYQHLYRIQLDGTELTLLTPEDAEHIVNFSPNLQYFVDTFSRVDFSPVSVLRAANGALIRELEQADIEQLLALGYQIPERITVKALDGVTDLYGVMVRPAQFDPSRIYPVIDYIYGGPQRTNTPKSFAWQPLENGRDPLGGAQSFAQLGFVTIIMDGMGTPHRNKSFHDACYGNLQEAAGLPDHVVGTKQLAERFPFIDLDRVGIWGLSGGGYASTRAILSYPNFYKVAVSACGNHDNRLYNALWAERYQGSSDLALYDEQDNSRLVHNLKGHLLLVHGDADDNVHPALTMRMVDALIKADKDFDMLILPNRHHVFILEPYFLRRKWDYFVRHLMGVEPPRGYTIGNDARNREKSEIDIEGNHN